MKTGKEKSFATFTLTALIYNLPSYLGHQQFLLSHTFISSQLLNSHSDQQKSGWSFCISHYWAVCAQAHRLKSGQMHTPTSLIKYEPLPWTTFLKQVWHMGGVRFCRCYTEASVVFLLKKMQSMFSFFMWHLSHPNSVILIGKCLA